MVVVGGLESVGWAGESKVTVGSERAFHWQPPEDATMVMVREGKMAIVAT